MIYQGLQAMLDPGEEVVVPLPCFASYPGMIAMLGAIPVYVVCEKSAGFKLSATQLADAIGPRTKAVILNSPNNPTGATYSRRELRALTDVLLEHPHVWILADDIYEHLVFDDAEFASIVEVEPQLKGRTLTVNGISKAYAMTGWRIGYAGGPERLMVAIRKIISQTISNPSSIAQAAEMLATAKEPVLLVGGGARHAATEIRELSKARAIPVVTTIAGKGVVPSNERLCLDCFQCLPGTQALLAQSDLLIALGTEMAETDTIRLGCNCRLIECREHR